MLVASNLELGARERDTTVRCTLCPVMETIAFQGPCSALHVKMELSVFLGIALDSVELYVRSRRGFLAVPNESLEIGDCYALLRIRGGKGGFRKQLEKKGRAFARARKLRRSNQTAPSVQQVEDAAKKFSIDSGDKDAEITEKASTGREEAQLGALLEVNVRNTVRKGVKRVLECLTDTSE